jgi:hypothetical protein
VEEADRLGVELLAPGPVAFHVGQAVDAMTLQTAMKGRAGELRNRSLECVEAIVQRQQRVLVESYEDVFLLNSQTVDLGMLGPIRRSAVDSRFFHLATVFG